MIYQLVLSQKFFIWKDKQGLFGFFGGQMIDFAWESNNCRELVLPLLEILPCEVNILTSKQTLFVFLNKNKNPCENTQLVDHRLL